MTKIAIEINCNEQICGGCNYLYQDIVYKQNNYCRQFQTFIGDSTKGDLIRCEKCISAEVKEVNGFRRVSE